jgi:hypothetical protein
MYCRICKKTVRSVKVLSRNGLCDDCALSRVKEAWTQLREKRGSYYERWAAKRGLLVSDNCGQRTLLDWV